MTYPLALTPEAADDLIDARKWYESREEGLGSRFQAHVWSTFKEIQRRPDLPALFLPPRIRRAHVEKFPFSICYIFEGDRIVVVGVLHDRSDLVRRLRKRLK